MSWEFCAASQAKAQKNASATHTHGWGNVQKGAGGKPNVGLDALSVTAAVSAPKTNTQPGLHKCPTTAPKMANEWTNDKAIQAGEFESHGAASTADTGVGRAAVRSTESGEFESTPAPSHADTHGAGRAVLDTQSGEFESTPQARQW